MAITLGKEWGAEEWGAEKWDGFNLRPERPGDEIFLRQLFDSSRPLAAQLAHLPADLREMILRGQFQAQRAGHAAQFPHAARLLILVQDAPAGRVMFDATGQTLHIADIALLPAYRGQGIGTKLLRALGAQHPLSLEVADDNFAAQRLYARLGFVLTAQQSGSLALVRPASG
jgi:ribosomal protein S18 acetylase RimI-like enzyme